MHYSHFPALLVWALVTSHLPSFFASAKCSLTGSSAAVYKTGARLATTVESPVNGGKYFTPAGKTIDFDIVGSAGPQRPADDWHWTYVFDVSGSTSSLCCPNLPSNHPLFDLPVVDCEKVAAQEHYNDQLLPIALPEDDVAISIFAGEGEPADMDSAPGDQEVTFAGDAAGFNAVTNSVNVLEVGLYTLKRVTDMTSYVAGLSAALESVNASPAYFKDVVFFSDGKSNTGTLADFYAVLGSLVAKDAVIYSFAVGHGVNCTDGEVGTLQEMADQSGGLCEEWDPCNPRFVAEALSIRVKRVMVKLNGKTLRDISFSDSKVTATARNLSKGRYTACIDTIGVGPDRKGKTTKRTCACVRYTIHDLQLTPAVAKNVLGKENTHTVTATVNGPGSLAGIKVNFSIEGPNTGTPGVCSPNLDCTTDVNGKVSFAYSVEDDPVNLGVDKIKATVSGANEASVIVQKHWVGQGDTVPPTASCVIRRGRYTASAVDNVSGADEVKLFVRDRISGHVFDDFGGKNPINFKWIKNRNKKPKQWNGSGEFDFILRGKGDPLVYAQDSAGNLGGRVRCRRG